MSKRYTTLSVPVANLRPGDVFHRGARSKPTRFFFLGRRESVKAQGDTFVRCYLVDALRYENGRFGSKVVTLPNGFELEQTVQCERSPSRPYTA